MGWLEKGARHWDAAAAGAFLEAACIGQLAGGEGSSDVSSCSSELKGGGVGEEEEGAVELAVQAGGVRVSELSDEDKEVLVRDYLIPSGTPNPTPRREEQHISSDQPEHTDEGEREESLQGGSDESSEDSDDSSDDDMQG